MNDLLPEALNEGQVVGYEQVEAVWETLLARSAHCDEDAPRPDLDRLPRSRVAHWPAAWAEAVRGARGRAGGYVQQLRPTNRLLCATTSMTLVIALVMVSVAFSFLWTDRVAAFEDALGKTEVSPPLLPFSMAATYPPSPSPPLALCCRFQG